MRKFLFFLLIAISSANAQEITLKWAEKIPTKGYISILGGKDGYYFTTHVNRNDDLVGRKYDANMQLVSEKSIAFNVDNKKYGYTGAYFVDKSIIHFITDERRKEDKEYLLTGFTDFNLTTTDKMIVADERGDDDRVLKFGTRAISPDSTKVMVYHEKAGKKKEPTILIYKVYNATFTDVINEGAASLPIKTKNYSTDDVTVDNLGNVYVMARIIKEKDEKGKNLSDYYYKLIVFGKDKTVKEFDFDYKDNNISYVDMIPGKNNTFFCTGFLTNLKGGKKRLISDEMFFATFDCNKLTLSESKMLKVDGLYPDEIKKNEDYVPYKIRAIYEKKDGGYSVVAEQYKLIVVTSYSNGVYRESYIYYYCDIACVQTDNKANVLSITRIPKYQKNAGNPSIISTFKDDKTYVVYEDLTKNLSAQDDKSTKRSTKTMFSSDSKNSLFLLTVGGDGTVNKEILYDYRDSKIKPRILGSRQTAPGKILLNADDQLGLIEIK
ncbi:hypothetical protein ACLI09_01290 [Flavobacterium sp. RHBU_24]|uniref:hypothetical protein n=1 Tax=Flavobacterium sp. RHBU_24 TaxID=3391185 RepID=UPI0039846CD7